MPVPDIPILVSPFIVLVLHCEGAKGTHPNYLISLFFLRNLPDNLLKQDARGRGFKDSSVLTMLLIVFISPPLSGTLSSSYSSPAAA